ncbi:hypothetical protein HAX54_040601, partial [Datura stramonium]|nr:hypothetical protein [Datura stramonium]
ELSHNPEKEAVSIKVEKEVQENLARPVHRAPHCAGLENDESFDDSLGVIKIYKNDGMLANLLGMLVNVGDIIKDVFRRERVKKGQRFGFGGLLTRFLRRYQIEEEETDYRPRYDPRAIDVT